ncbi:pyrroloquinoline quinone biosynthesis protein PqqE [Lutibaculum baratangense]|uniref:PqqA peptide cyclase n=1 Tax=Lutibaculum baratangense AMV1 TaxID=631454 RepID=V4RKG0_9HYPH|nr:pyrroloquinoline quinone biosynthesis protein PqqE [Lutibaculum baratangense]ESR25809.1 Coenzyme PQQ synthesis protein E [Lutibaculum baratangense AMV1]
MNDIPAPIGMLAELTHRCPLSCPYCSNPVELDARQGELSTAEWLRVFDEAKALGVLQVHLSGGEPGLRRDLEEIVARCAEHGIYTNLITSGVQIDEARLARLGDAGLDHVQLSIQDVEIGPADEVAGMKGAHLRKMAFARHVREQGFPLTVNLVVHRGNIARLGRAIDLAAEMGAKRLEVAHVQYYGWAFVNRASLMPEWPQVEEALKVTAEAQARLKGRMVIDSVTPDYYARRPKACMGGWGSRALNVTPAGKVLPCHAAETIPGLEFWTVRDHSLADIWANAPAFNAFRGTDWIEEPCSSCEIKASCRGGCRCQALAIAGRAEAADPACEKSAYHEVLRDMAREDAVQRGHPYRYRTMKTPTRDPEPVG